MTRTYHGKKKAYVGASPSEQLYPRCKQCGRTGIETNEWFGPGDMNGKHLCLRCFTDASDFYAVTTARLVGVAENHGGGWWRWALRGVAVLALVAGGVLLTLHPTVSYQPPFSPSADQGIPLNLRVPFLCISPFSQLTGNQALVIIPLVGPYIPPQVLRAASASCSAATNDREHIVEALGIGAVLLVGLSFLPRRREPAR